MATERGLWGCLQALGLRFLPLAYVHTTLLGPYAFTFRSPSATLTYLFSVSGMLEVFESIIIEIFNQTLHLFCATFGTVAAMDVTPR